jgi:hypothetical protein
MWNLLIALERSAGAGGHRVCVRNLPNQTYVSRYNERRGKRQQKKKYNAEKNKELK